MTLDANDVLREQGAAALRHLHDSAKAYQTKRQRAAVRLAYDGAEKQGNTPSSWKFPQDWPEPGPLVSRMEPEAYPVEALP